jgi:hypothetical protein
VSRGFGGVAPRAEISLKAICENDRFSQNSRFRLHAGAHRGEIQNIDLNDIIQVFIKMLLRSRVPLGPKAKHEVSPHFHKLPYQPPTAHEWWRRPGNIMVRGSPLVRGGQALA